MLIDNSFHALIEFMSQNPEAAACGPKLLNPDGTLQHDIRRFAGLGVFVLQTLNWHKLFPGSRIMGRYYMSDFDFAKAQQVEAIGTSVFMMRRETWENAGLLDERFRWAMVDLAYEYVLARKGYKIYYTPSTQVIHFGSQTANQNVPETLREQCKGLIDFSETYDYFGKNFILKAIIRAGIRLRYWLKVLEYHLGSDKRVIKGPGRPSKLQAAEAPLLLRQRVRSLRLEREKKKHSVGCSESDMGISSSSGTLP
jgi:hypothetical protein